METLKLPATLSDAIRMRWASIATSQPGYTHNAQHTTPYTLLATHYTRVHWALVVCAP